MHMRINARQLVPPPGYSHAVVASGTTVYVSGAIPLDGSGRLVGAGDRAVQTRQVLDNLRIQLAAAGAQPEQVVKTTVYVVGTSPDELHQAWEVIRASEFADAASTLLGVAALAVPGQLVEVEATAVLGGGAAIQTR